MKAMVLSSGGLDSTTCLAKAIDENGAENVSTVSILYGQKHSLELEKAKAIADYYKVPHYELNLTEIFKYNKTCTLLKQSTAEVAKSSYQEQLRESDGKAIATFVPFRNGLFTAAIVSFAMGIYPGEEIKIYMGIHQDDTAAAYPDCSPSFNEAMKEAVFQGTGGLVTLYSPFVNSKKADIVKYGLEHNVPYHLTLSCYDPDENGVSCGSCGTCIDRQNAFYTNNAVDPIKYKHRIENKFINN